MRQISFLLVVMLAAGCGKKSSPTTEAPAAREPGFAEDNPEDTLAWLAAQRNALDANGDKESAEKFKALADTMKGRQINWPGTLVQINSDKTYGVMAWLLNTDPPEPKGEEGRERHYILVCKPHEPGTPLPENAPFVRRPEVGFPSGAGDWHNDARPGLPIRLKGTIAAVQLHRNSWVTGSGVKDRVVHTEVGITLHITNGIVSPAP